MDLNIFHLDLNIFQPGCGGPAPPAYLHSALMYYHGIVAVGLMEGRLVLVDLNMDEVGESKETTPAGLYFITPVSRDVSRYKTC